jgi:hypothetical protein
MLKMYCTVMKWILPAFVICTELKGVRTAPSGRCCIMNIEAHFSIVVLGVEEEILSCVAAH